jgi:hypothetical protein
MIHKTEGINVSVLQEDIIILVESIGDLEVPHISSWICCLFCEHYSYWFRPHIFQSTFNSH